MRSMGVVLVVVAGLAVASGPVAGRSSGAPAATRTAAAAQPSGFDADGIGDLAVGAPGERVRGAVGAGAVHVLYGAVGAMNPTGQTFTQGTGGVPGGSEAGDGFGSAVAQGNFNGDGRFDLAVGAPGEDLGGVAGAGAVTVLYGTDAELRAAWAQLRTQANAEAGDRLGAALAAIDFDADGYWDLAVGAPWERVGSAAGAGAVGVVFGATDGGLGADGSQFFYQGGGGLGSTAEAGDLVAASVG